jgi:hypothetical protein
VAVGGHGEGQIGKGKDGPALDDVCSIEVFVFDYQSGLAIAKACLKYFDAGESGVPVPGKKVSGSVRIHDVSVVVWGFFKKISAGYHEQLEFSFKIKACEEFYRRHITDIPRIKF